jgi:hypothetical protein
VVVAIYFEPKISYDYDNQQTKSSMGIQKDDASTSTYITNNYSDDFEQHEQSKAGSGSIAMTLHVCREEGDISNRKVTVFLEDKTTSAYQATYYLKGSPNLELRRGDDHSAMVGSATFHLFSGTIDVDMMGTALALKKTDLLGKERDFTFMGSRYAVKATGQGTGHTLTKDIKLVDTQQPNDPIMFYRRKAGVTKMGEFEFMMNGLSQEHIDTFVIATLAVVEKERRNTQSSGAGAAQGGGGGLYLL